MIFPRVTHAHRMRVDRTRKPRGNLNSDRNRHLNTASPRHFLTQRFEAGLRAHEIWRTAFPWRGCHPDHSGILVRPHSLTVAGAAQALENRIELLGLRIEPRAL